MTSQLLAMIVGAVWSVAVAYLAIGNGQRRVAHCAFFAMTLFVAGAFAVTAFAEPLATYPVQVRFTSSVLAESHLGVVQNGNDLPIVQPLASDAVLLSDGEYGAILYGADPTREVTVSVAAVSSSGEVAESNKIAIYPQVSVCRQMDIDDQPGVTVTDVARVMEAVVSGECDGAR